ncbi:MAG TPA: hypothetical protein VIL20_24725 [Sandaracinaceae bacterium]
MDAHAKARALARSLESIADPSIRVRYVRSVIEAMRPADAAELVTVAVSGAEARDGSQGALLLALCLALADEDAVPVRDAIVRAALERGHHATASLLSPARAAREAAEDEPAVPDFGTGRPLTLGERKALARRRDRQLLARVLHDPHPDVIRILLTNPALTEDDVLRLCARRPVPPEVLREVFRSTRWIVRYRVRRAIVQNPFAPIDVALQLAVHLDAPDARAIATAGDLSPAVRDACRRVAGMMTVH